jgi:hypothetical protein
MWTNSNFLSLNALPSFMNPSFFYFHRMHLSHMSILTNFSSSSILFYKNSFIPFRHIWLSLNCYIFTWFSTLIETMVFPNLDVINKVLIFLPWAKIIALFEIFHVPPKIFTKWPMLSSCLIEIRCFSSLGTYLTCCKFHNHTIITNNIILHSFLAWCIMKWTVYVRDPIIN